MSWYNSENTKVLATHLQEDGNLRMLLLHEMSSGRIEYVIGSYFTETTEISSCQEYERTDYSWDWGHYFSDVVDAVRYWERDVLGEGSAA